MRMLATVLLVMGAMGCKAGEGQRCAKPEDCNSGLTCGPSNTCETPEVVKRQLEDVKCRKSRKCRLWGKCTASDGKCIATSDEDCRRALGRGGEATGLGWPPICKGHGLCTARNGECIAGSDADCQQSDSCRKYGECMAKNGECRR